MSWFIVAFIAQSIAIVVLWVQVSRVDKYASSMGDFVEQFAMATMSHIRDLETKEKEKQDA